MFCNSLERNVGEGDAQTVFASDQIPGTSTGLLLLAIIFALTPAAGTFELERV